MIQLVTMMINSQFSDGRARWTVPTVVQASSVILIILALNLTIQRYYAGNALIHIHEDELQLWKKNCVVDWICCVFFYSRKMPKTIIIAWCIWLYSQITIPPVEMRAGHRKCPKQTIVLILRLTCIFALCWQQNKMVIIKDFRSKKWKKWWWSWTKCLLHQNSWGRSGCGVWHTFTLSQRNAKGKKNFCASFHV